MALLLNNLDHRVLINDKSSRKDFMTMFSDYDLKERLLTYRNIDIYFGDCRNEHYDFILDYTGDLNCPEQTGSYRYIIVNSSMNRQEILDHLKQAVSLKKGNNTGIKGYDRRWQRQDIFKPELYEIYDICIMSV